MPDFLALRGEVIMQIDAFEQANERLLTVELGIEILDQEKLLAQLESKGVPVET